MMESRQTDEQCENNIPVTYVVLKGRGGVKLHYCLQKEKEKKRKKKMVFNIVCVI